MYEWHRAHGLQSRDGPGRYAEPTWYITWCFANAEDADAFAAEFGGTRLTNAK
jgi:hypothetical protein